MSKKQLKLKIDKEVSYREIEMLKIVLYLASRKQSNIVAGVDSA